MLVFFRQTKHYSVDIFSYSGPSGILGSDNGVVGVVALSIGSREQTQ